MTTNVDFDYIRDGQEIYRQSFSIIRAETDLQSVPPDMERAVVRVVHACGMVDIVDDLRYSPDVGGAATNALRSGAPILTDSHMVANGITRKRLPAENQVICTLRDPAVADLASTLHTTRSAAALDLWLDDLEGAVVAIGNAPTVLFRLLELVAQGAPRPAAILGFPVGFVGAAESKDALTHNQMGIPYFTVMGRRGGSAMAAAAVNAWASEEE